jgi:hypothetical protein
MTGTELHVDPKELPTDQLVAILGKERAAIVGLASQSVRHGDSRYEMAGSAETLRRIELLYDQMTSAIAGRDLGDIVGYARELAHERFESGYDLVELQAAFNALEEATWSTLCARLEPELLAVSLGLVSTVLGAAKDALSREYVSLASSMHVSSLDLSALFTGSGG